MSPRYLQGLIGLGLLFGLVLVGDWRRHFDWYDPTTGNRLCRAAPDAIDAWARTNVRRPTDRQNLDEWLNRHPANANAQYGPRCRTALHLAARFGRDDLVEAILAHGAVVNSLDEYDETPLYTAAEYAHADAVRVLIRHGANVNAGARMDRTPLHAVAFGGMGGRIEDRLAVAQVLLDAGADVNARERGNNFTPMRYAAGPGLGHDERMVSFLLAHGANPESADQQGNALLIDAAVTGHAQTVKYLLDNGADVNRAGRHMTPLAAAASAGRLEVATLLIERGADVNRRVSGSRLDWDGLPLAMTIGADPSKDRDAIARRHDVARLLVAKGADVNARTKAGETLLHRAASEGDLDVLNLLLAHGAGVSSRDDEGFTPLHRAVKDGRLQAAARLLAAGADPRAATTAGATAIDLASGDRDMQALLQRHAKS